MKYLGIDYGSKRIGIAASDERGVFAFARKTVPNDESIIDTIRAIVEKEHAEAVVLGVPTTEGFVQNPVEDEIRAFAVQLGERSGLPVYFQNEQFSSRESSRFAPGEVKDDAASAAIILQRYLDANPQAE